MGVKQHLLLVCLVFTINKCSTQFFDKVPLYQINAGTFKDYQLSYIKNVSMAECRISTIDRYTFSQMVRLIAIRIDHNELSSLHENLFDSNVKLEYINLSWNRFQSLPPYIFSKLTSLKELSLYKNNIKTLNLHLFENLRSLTKLMIYSNGLKDLDANIFRNNINMEYLHFGDNLIEYLHEDIFNNVPKLNSLMMHRNKIKYLSNKIFSRLHNLQNVSIAFNEINDLPSGIFDNNRDLSNVWLGANKLTILKSGLFINAVLLRYLSLDGNQITHIELDVFPVKLQRLYLSNNSLNTIDSKVIANLNYLTDLTLDLNPWLCDCHLREVFNKWKQLNLRNKIPSCAEPSHLKNRFWSTLNINDFPSCKVTPKLPSLTTADVTGDQANLGCKIDPSENVSWTFGDVPLAEHFKALNKPYKICESNSADGKRWYNLTIDDLMPSDSGKYKCNGVEQDLFVTPDQLRKLQKPTLSLSSTKQFQLNADFGENIDAGCQIYSRGQKPNLVWSFNNQPLDASSSGGGKYEFKNANVDDRFAWYNLTILSVKDADSGVYACQANGYNEINEFTLKVNKKLNTYIQGWTDF